MGPAFFFLYLNGIGNSSKLFNTKLYAYDATLSFEGKILFQARQIINPELEENFVLALHKPNYSENAQNALYGLSLAQKFSIGISEKGGVFAFKCQCVKLDACLNFKLRIYDSLKKTLQTCSHYLQYRSSFK